MKQVITSSTNDAYYMCTDDDAFISFKLQLIAFLIVFSKELES